MSGPSSVIATVCSKCAVSEPSLVTTVQPSSSSIKSDRRRSTWVRWRRSCRPASDNLAIGFGFSCCATNWNLRLFVHGAADAVSSIFARHAVAYSCGAFRCRFGNIADSVVDQRASIAETNASSVAVSKRRAERVISPTGCVNAASPTNP